MLSEIIFLDQFCPMPVRNQVFPYGSSSSSTPSPPRALVIPKLYVKVISLFMFYSREHKTAQCCFLCRKLSIGKFKFQVSFSFGSFVSGKNIWNALSLSCIYFCVSWLQAHKTRTSSNLIRKGHDVTNMLRTSWMCLVQTLPNICLMIQMIKDIWKIFAPCRVCL